MKGFEPVTLQWGGVEYTVPANQQLMLIAEIEDALDDGSGRSTVGVLLGKGGPSYARLAGAFGAALRYAGAPVSDADIYLTIQEGFSEGSKDAAGQVQGAILALLSIVSPPMARKLMDVENAAKKMTAPETTKRKGRARTKAAG
jgi:hypothetical protein